MLQGRTLSALSQLPLVALRLSRVKYDNVCVHGVYENGVVGQCSHWRSAVHDLAADIADKITSLSVMSIGEGMQTTVDGVPGHCLIGPASWWRIVANDEPPSTTLDGECEEHIRENNDSGDFNEEDSASNEEVNGSDDGSDDEDYNVEDEFSEESCESSSTQDEDEFESNLTSAETLGPNASRRLVSISRDLGEHIRAYMLSSEFTEISAFDDELFERLSRTVVPRGVGSEP